MHTDALQSPQASAPTTAVKPLRQLTLPFAGRHAAEEPTTFDAVGFEIGWDHARHRLVPPAEHLLTGHPVRQGWQAGREVFGHRTLKPSRHVQRWLELRLGAWLAGRTFEDVMLTPHYLAQIDTTHCPVTREPLTHGGAASVAPGDAVVVALADDAAVAAGHLVVMSRRAVVARGRLDAAQAWKLARRIEAGELGAVGGLGAAEWQRLATLLACVNEQPHEAIACLPLAALPPNRLRVLNPVQALQTLLTLLFTGSAFARRMSDLGALMPDADTRRHYVLFMNTMLARRLAAGWSADRATVRTTLEDAWTHPLVLRRWEQLALRLSRAACERIVRLAARRGLAGPGWRWLDDKAATEGRQPEAPAAAAMVPVGVDGPARHAAAATA